MYLIWQRPQGAKWPLWVFSRILIINIKLLGSRKVRQLRFWWNNNLETESILHHLEFFIYTLIKVCFVGCVEYVRNSIKLYQQVPFRPQMWPESSFILIVNKFRSENHNAPLGKNIIMARTANFLHAVGSHLYYRNANTWVLLSPFALFCIIGTLKNNITTLFYVLKVLCNRRVEVFDT